MRRLGGRPARVRSDFPGEFRPSSLALALWRSRYGVGTRTLRRTPARAVRRAASRRRLALFLAVLAALAALAATGPALAATTSVSTGITYAHGLAFLREPGYPLDFEHFRFVRPDAPKGGQIRWGEMGNWDSFNEVALSGRAVAGVSIQGADPLSLIYDTLLTHAIDTPTDRYGRLAEGVAVAPDGAWVAFLLRPGARWHDGTPITVTDYQFTFDVYTTRANPTIRLAFAPFERFEALNAREIRFWIRPELRGRPGVAFILGSMAILPAHYWATRDITRPTLEPPLGSGPYRIGSFRTGRRIEFQRVADYWGQDLPVNRGRYNFDRVVFDYFRDDQVLYEAVKGDLIDLREETVPVRWATGYDSPARRRGELVLAPSRLLRPAGMWWPIFWNQRVPRLTDVRVREALYLLRDGDWSNRVLSYGFWENPTSFFHDSEFAHRGQPSALELKYLEPLRDRVPPRVFTEPFTVPAQAGAGWHRDRVARALELFRAAGWQLTDGVLRNTQTGEPFTLRLLAVSPALAASFIPYVHVLRKVGISAEVSSPETSSWLHRSRTGDFDGGALWFLPDSTPTLLAISTFSSSTLGDAYSPNWAGINDPAVDNLLDALTRVSDHDEFVAVVRALDRVLMWNFYYAPTMSRVTQALVYWDRFGRVEPGRLVRLAAIDTWWWDDERADRIDGGGEN